MHLAFGAILIYFPLICRVQSNCTFEVEEVKFTLWRSIAVKSLTGSKRRRPFALNTVFVDNISVGSKVAVMKLEDVIDVSSSVFELHVLVWDGIGPPVINDKFELLAYPDVNSDKVDWICLEAYSNWVAKRSTELLAENLLAPRPILGLLSELSKDLDLLDLSKFQLVQVYEYCGPKYSFHTSSLSHGLGQESILDLADWRLHKLA